MKNKIISNVIIGTFVSLYALVSIVSTIHVVDFFELSNPTWLAITLAIGFEIGAAASLASLVILKKMNKTLVWSLFIAITLMQMQGNMYYAFINLGDFTSWSEVFNLIEEDLIYQKRILAFVSGAILPLIALGFIKSLVDYIKPEDEDDETLTSGTMDDNMLSKSNDDFETQPSKEYFEDIEEEVKLKDLDVEVDPIEFEEVEDVLTEEEKQDIADFNSVLNDGLDDEPWDEDHEMDMVMNDMVKDFTQEDVEAIVETNENTPEPNQKLKDAADVFTENNPTSVGAVVNDIVDNIHDIPSIVEQIPSPHLPQEDNIKTEDQLWNDAMAKKAKEEMEAFIKNKNANK